MPDLVIDSGLLPTMKCKHVFKYFPDWNFSWENDQVAYFEGWVGIDEDGSSYQLRLCINPQTPEICPALYVWDPIILPGFQSETINESMGHTTHTLGNGPEGRVQICHMSAGDWDPSVSYIVPILRGILWLYAYEGLRKTGKRICDFFPN